jgi:hypothetical protein
MIPVGDGGPEAQSIAERTSVLVIVARDQPGLLRYLVNDFPNFKTVQAVFDRRHGKRRNCTRPCESDRRRVDRRLSIDNDSRLRRDGYVIVLRQPEGNQGRID